MLKLKYVEGGSKATPPFKATHIKYGEGERIHAPQLLDVITGNSDEGLWVSYSSDFIEAFIETIKVMGETSFPLLVDTEQTDNEFYKEIGEFVSLTSGFDARTLSKMMMEDNPDGFYIMVGVSTLDAFLPNGYLIRFGKEDLNNIEIGTMHGVKTFSKNQKVIKVRRDRL